MTNREKMMAVFREALGSALPGNLIRETLRHEAGLLTIGGEGYRLGDYRGIHLFGSGKASVETARAVKAVLGGRLTDGHSDAAGALVDHASWEKAQALGLRVDDFLARNDSYHFLQQTGDLIMTGPTGTNVMDMTALLIS